MRNSWQVRKPKEPSLKEMMGGMARLKSRLRGGAGGGGAMMSA